MTIKPIVTPTQKRVTVSAADSEKKEALTHGPLNSQVAIEQQENNIGGHSKQNVARSTSVHTHRNVVLEHVQANQRRVDVFDEVTRQRRSPQKSSRVKRLDLQKRNRLDREKLLNVPTVVNNKCRSPHLHGVVAANINKSGGNNSPVSVGSKSPEHLPTFSKVLNNQVQKSQNKADQDSTNLLKSLDETFSGYNSGDEHLQTKEGSISAEEWKRRDEQFEKCMAERGYILRSVEEDGACLFRAISLQIYGDEEMHDVIRQHTMDYIYKNREYFSHFVTEDINNYIKRKRRNDSHGNHIEIQAMSEIYNRPVEVYCYKPTAINIFNSEQLKNGYAPLRLSYQRGSHYNAIIDPYNATVGEGLGLAGYKPDLQTKDAARLSEQLEIEQTMFEDKLKTTDWEATNEVIEEQIARESYLQWCRDNLQKTRAVSSTVSSSSTATVTSSEVGFDAVASPSKYSIQRGKNNCTSEAVAPAVGISGAGTSCESNNKFGKSNTIVSPVLHTCKTDTPSCDLGFESDGTDISSTSSISNAGNGSINGKTSPMTRLKKTKASGNNTIRGAKKRRRENLTESKQSTEQMAKRSPNHVVASKPKTRECTPEAEQRPSTSKQSNFAGKDPKTSNEFNEHPISSLYQELLEAAYTADGFGQSNESEMLQRAIQLSTQDYIEEQKRKYLYWP